MMFFTGCRKPLQMIFPYNENPESQIPGKALFYASALPSGGYMQGVLVETHEGRPTKVEGNPQHPDSLGATDIFMQAAILSLYDPDRSQTVMNKGIISSWDTFLKAMRQALQEQKAGDGEGLRLLTETVISPSLAHQIQFYSNVSQKLSGINMNRCTERTSSPDRGLPSEKFWKHNTGSTRRK